MSIMSDEGALNSVLVSLKGEVCCRQRVGRGRSLSLGFGKKIFHNNPRLVDSFHGEWELGTYSSSWRFVCEDKIICGSHDVMDSIQELDALVSRVKIGSIESISLLSKFDIRVYMTNIYIDFIGAESGDDEMFHIFCPNNQYLAYSSSYGWSMSHGK